MVSEHELVRRARQGSHEAASELFRHHWRAAWQIAYSVLGSRAAADDAAQEAMISAFRSLEGFDVRRPFGPWIKRIAYNRAVDELRRRRPDSASTEPEDPAPELAAAGPASAAVARLSLDRRTVIVLHYWLDCTQAEIAEILGVPTGTVASRLGRALDELRSRLEEEHVH
jgi:RNA polymerase sigma-70 factor (ECF subfamily)